MKTLSKKLSSGSSKTARAVLTLALAISSLLIGNSGASAQTATSSPATTATANDGSMSPSTANDSSTSPSTGNDSPTSPATGNDSSVRSPTSTRTEVRSPTSTSTEAYTSGNVTVTGGAGDGATSVNIYPPAQPKLVLSGGPASVYADGAPQMDPRNLELGIPTLGICYGMQLMAQQLGGTVESNDVSEYGKAEATLSESALFHDLPVDQTVWMSHRDSVTAPPPGARVTASSTSTPIAGFEDPARALYAVQFHPEVVHTPYGQDILKNFLYDVAGAPPAWTPAAVIEEQVERIRAQVGSERVICGLSGGVDSAVAALLVHKAVGDQLTCVFVDHGFLRKNEAEQVVETFGGHFRVPLVHVQAQERFLARLAGVTDPEEQAQAHRRGVHPRVRGGGEGARHRAVPRPGHALLGRDRVGRRRGGRRREDQVAPQRRRAAGRHEDGARRAAAAAVQGRGAARRRGARHARADGVAPAVPGPGLAIRIIGEVTPERLDILRAADAVLQEEIRKAGLYRDLWQSFAVLPAIKSVGVQGDERTYAYPIVIRAVTSEDAMTADWARLPTTCSRRSRAASSTRSRASTVSLLDLSSKPPATIEWE